MSMGIIQKKEFTLVLKLSGPFQEINTITTITTELNTISDSK